MPKCALCIIVGTILGFVAIVMASEGSAQEFVLPETLLSEETQPDSIDFDSILLEPKQCDGECLNPELFNTEFRGQSVYGAPPKEYYDFLHSRNRIDSYPPVQDVNYNFRYSSDYCQPYWSEVFKDLVPVRNDNMVYSRVDEWTFQILPSNIIYKSYMACGREPRLGIHFVDSMQPDDMSYWDCSIGARVSLIRFGSKDPLYPEGLELEMDACAFPRLTLNRARDLYSCDYRFAFPLAYRKGRWEFMFGYYHISSHLGDEYMVKHNSLQRYNYSRDCLMAGVGYRPNPAWRFYFNMEYAFSRDDGSKPWHFIFGLEYSPMYTGVRGAPFLAMSCRLREDVDFSGSFTLETGWQWRNDNSHIFRLGLFYLNGYSDHYQFYNIYEKQIGMGIWYDF